MIHFLRICAMEMKLARSSWSESFAVVVEPTAYALIIGLLFRGADPGRAALAVLGAGMMGAWTSVLYAAASSLQTSRQMAVLELLTATPTPLYRVTAAASVSAALLGLVPVGAAGLIGHFVFGLRMTPADPGTFALGLALFFLGLVTVGMLIAPLFVSYPHATALANVGDYPAFIIGGLLVPVTFLPAWVQPLSYLFPPSWGVRLMQDSLPGTAGGVVLPVTLALVSCTVAAVGGVALMRRLEAAALRSGTLGVI